MYGGHFKLFTDNQPLKTIFNPKNSLSSIVTLRLLRYAVHLRQFDYELQYRSTKLHGNVNFLFRNHTPKKATTTCPDVDQIQMAAIQQISFSSDNAITADQLCLATVADKEVSKLLSNLKTGKLLDSKYSICDRIILRGQNCVVIPEAC